MTLQKEQELIEIFRELGIEKEDAKSCLSALVHLTKAVTLHGTGSLRSITLPFRLDGVPYTLRLSRENAWKS